MRSRCSKLQNRAWGDQKLRRSVYQLVHDILRWRLKLAMMMGSQSSKLYNMVLEKDGFTSKLHDMVWDGLLNFLQTSYLSYYSRGCLGSKMGMVMEF
jgi:hypothetical protein